MRAQVPRQIGLLAHLAKPVAEAGGSEWLAVISSQKREMTALRHCIDCACPLRQDGYIDVSAGLLLVQ